MTSAGAVFSPEGVELDRIALVGLSGRGHHGVLPEERRAGQRFGVDVVLHVDTRAAAASDDLGDTVDYGTLAGDVVAVLTGEPVDLIETLAQRIADVALAPPAVQAVDVVVHKPEAPVPVPFADVQVAIRRHRGGLDRRPAGAAHVVLALGGNVGDVSSTLRAAIADLRSASGFVVEAVSPLARTAAVGPAQADYLNAVLTGRTDLSARELLGLTSSIEDAHGRVRAQRWGPRTLDIDIVAVDGVASSEPDLVLPHPRARERAFVLMPWARIEPDAVLPGPGGGSVAALAAAAPDRDGVEWLTDQWWDSPSDTDPDTEPAAGWEA